MRRTPRSPLIEPRTKNEWHIYPTIDPWSVYSKTGPARTKLLGRSVPAAFESA